MSNENPSARLDFNQLSYFAPPFLHVSDHTSRTAQGGSGSFKDRKPIPIGEACCRGMDGRAHPRMMDLNVVEDVSLSLSLCHSLSIMLSLSYSLSLYLSRSLSVILSIILSLSLSSSVFLSLPFSSLSSFFSHSRILSASRHNGQRRAILDLSWH